MRIAAEWSEGRVYIHLETPVASGRPAVLTTERFNMACRLVELSGGHIRLRFDDADRHFLAATLDLPATEQVSVLVIDDNVDMLSLLERYLSNSRYRFLGTSNPREVFALAGRYLPRAVVLDVMLPDVDGWEILQRLREHPTTRDVPIIVCTILPHRQLAMTLGAAAFIQKPVTREALLSALDSQTGALATDCP
jgi:CheY-like chemotaxis protein